MNPELLITNIGFTISAVVTIGFAIFTLVKNPHKELNIAFFLMALVTGIYTISHVVGINIADPALSRAVFLLNMDNIFLPVFSAHVAFLITGRIEEMRHKLAFIYAIAIGMFAYFSMFPEHFMQLSKPIFYFPNYYVLGDQYVIFNIFFFAVAGYFLYHFFSTYRTADFALRNRLKYIIVAYIYGYTVGYIPELPLHGIYIDPIFSIFFSLYLIPFAYAVIKYDAMDIKIAAKQAALYSSGVVSIGFIIVLVNLLNQYITHLVPGFPIWLIPLISAFGVVGIGRLVWVKLREIDLMKYEFITIITHKFRTPLTRIRWSLEELETATTAEARRASMDVIRAADTHLVELTSTLSTLTSAENKEYTYKFSRQSVVPVIQKIAESERMSAHKKGIIFETMIEPSVPEINIDESRLQFAFQTVIDNAINYTLSGGKVKVTCVHDRHNVLVTVMDTGAGISKEELPRIFTKFYRAKNAREIDTEGMGIGLYVTRDIVKRHGGDIWAESDGEGKGTAISISIPL